MLTVKPYQYNTLCDTYGCNNRAKHSLGRDGYPLRAAYNVCPQCLEDIIMSAPFEMVLKRADVQAYIEQKCKDAVAKLAENEKSSQAVNQDTPNGEEDPTHKQVAKATEEQVVKEYSWNELRALAKDLNIDSYTQMKRPELERYVLSTLNRVSE